MKLLAAYIMRGRMQAILVTAVAALLSLLLPPFSYFSGAALGLVTLRTGPRSGLTVFAGALLAVGLLAAVILQQPLIAAGFAIVLWLPVLALATVLQQTVSLSRTVALSGLFGVLLVLGAYFVLEDPAGWWMETYRQLLAQAGTQAPGPEMEPVLREVAGIMTGAVAAALTLSIVGALFIARWWQALLYNPGGFREEFHRLALGRSLTLVALVLMGAAIVLGDPAAALAAELLVVVMLLFLINGLAVVHGLVARIGAGIGWLIAVYLMLLLALPQTAVTLAVVGLVDNWFGFRTYFGRSEDNK
ncbi:DUF2232 domain-containing protein [Thiohalomonas denitrificans]|uniref:Predicted membrane protein n=1 Tax=Thiohalomonas denitrificans TaxID=415747 RepID=A0A1G5PJU4_9GAMM|nr:DUF2232 domain-containing protein [Thiohalomonas denitrificans]SCZ49777.1 Predicted membrane protein [Thiohalomonas denitrificans]